MNSFSDLIRDLGGAAVIASAISEDAGLVRQWRSRDSVPPEFWPGLVALAAIRGLRGVTLASLAAIAVKRVRVRRKKSTPAQPDEASA